MATNPRSKVMEVTSRVLPHLSTATTSNTIMAATSTVITSTTNNTALQPTVDSSTVNMVDPNMADLPRHNSKHSQ